MRLLDKISQQVGLRQDVDLGQLGAARTELQEANPRFVLDPAASRACFDVVRRVTELFDPANPLLRMPSECFWVEAFEEADPREPAARASRMGVLIKTDAAGRAGFARHFAESPDGTWQRLPAWTEFDFDHPPSPRTANGFVIRHQTLSHLRPFLDHTTLHRDPGRLDADTRSLAEQLWFDLPLVAAFAAILASPGLLDSKSPDLARLNKARSKRGAPALLDHVEVRLVLGSSTGEAGERSGIRRGPPRLHYVRGHFVHRHGKSFWRSPHLRGDTTRSVVSRTVNVTAAGARR